LENLLVFGKFNRLLTYFDSSQIYQFFRPSPRAHKNGLPEPDIVVPNLNQRIDVTGVAEVYQTRC
jgi:hypothetical protein